ncbi:MAG TPA: aminoglycoside phosphotransferase [Thermomonospora sp.]|nr:aminoglycoside phosphotransferase [Thermomonospora sp.]
MTVTDTADRLAALGETVRLLWPEPARVTFGRSGGHVLVPDARRPRMLLPAHDRGAAVAALRAYGRVESRAARLVTAGLVWSFRTGLAGVLLRHRARVDVPAGADTIETHLGEALGRRVVVALYVRPAARANDKPVLQALAPGGPPVAFVKVGVNDLTRALVRAETAALHTVATAALRTVRVPEVLHAGRWRGLDVLALSPLPVWEPRHPVGEARLTEALREIAGVAGVRRHRLAASPYWSALHERVAALPDGGGALRPALEALGERRGGVEQAFGSWHGDFTPWNMAGLRDGLLVWDWERFATGVPLGFDALHLRLQRAVSAPGADAREAAATLVREAPAVLAPLGVPAGDAPVTALLYLAELAVRYLADRQAEAGARLGDVGSWLLPVLAAGARTVERDDG